MQRIIKELKKLPKEGLTRDQVLDCVYQVEPLPILPIDNNGVIEKCIRQLASFCITKCIRGYRMGKIIPTIQKIANNVYTELGPGWNEKVYQEAMKIEFNNLLPNLLVSSEVPTSIIYKGKQLGDGVYVRTDIILIENDKKILLELKVSKSSLDKAVNQCKRYLRLKGISVGLVINFPEKLYGRPICQTVFP